MAWLLGVALAVLSVTVLVAWVSRSFLVVTVDGPSMAPTLVPGDHVLVRRGVRGLRSGQIVVVTRPALDRGWRDAPPLSRDVNAQWWYIKRVVAVAGELLPEPLSGTVAVPDNHIIVMGDNVRSADSRLFGPCPMDQVLGVVVRRLG